jgi:prevent-host-death family protein
MKSVQIAELKAHLSHYLRSVRAGDRMVVLDRQEPIAEIVPTRAGSYSPWERLEREGKLHLGSQDWTTLAISPAKKRIPIQRILREVREDIEE